MSESLQEFVDSGSQRLRVDRAAGIIRGVKLLGLVSRNGRRYRETALTEAIGLYEGAKVNINHPKGHPLSPRDYQDRLGVVRSVHFRSGQGLFGDLHFNPKHALSEQLVWDAEHAPQNVGLSHNVLARTALDGGDTVVEAIHRVQSIDLVADPATTSGLYEHAAQQSPAAQTAESGPVTAWHELTLDELRRHRPDLIQEATLSLEHQLDHARKQIDELVAKEFTARRRDRILQLLQENGLPMPAKDGASSQLVSPQFMQSLMSADDEPSVVRLIQERAELLRAASRWNGEPRSSDQRPRSKDQVALTSPTAGGCIRNGQEFANAVRSR
jgi:hypothetical protein